MVQESIQATPSPAGTPSPPDAIQATPPATTARKPGRVQQAIAGVVPPQLAEGRIREEWPTVLGVAPGLASLGRILMQTYILAPLGFLVLLPAFLLKFGPFVCKRYTLTNRRLMIQRGLKPVPVQEVALADIDDIRLDSAGVDPFYISGTLEVIGKGQVILRLPGVPEPEGVRLAILNAVRAWVPNRAAGPFVPASAVK
jgi:hypothetical protein